MLRSSTRSRACLALRSSCQNLARIAAWLKFYLHVSVVGFSTPAPCAQLTLRRCAQSLKMSCYWLFLCALATAQGSVTGFKIVTAKSVKALIPALTQQLFVTIEVGSFSFQLYSDIVMQFRSSSNLDHEILAVRYCTNAARS